MDKIKLDLDNPIFTFYVNTDGMSRQRAEEYFYQIKEHFDVYENVTVWFIQSNVSKIECTYSGKRNELNVENLITDINERIDILSKSSSFDDFKINIRDWRINNLIDKKMDDYIYFIAYPGGDKTKITVCYESVACDYEINDYALASRQRWYSHAEANAYCKQLAKDNNLIFINSSDDGDNNDYLD